MPAQQARQLSPAELARERLRQLEEEDEDLSWGVEEDGAAGATADANAPDQAR